MRLSFLQIYTIAHLNSCVKDVRLCLVCCKVNQPSTLQYPQSQDSSPKSSHFEASCMITYYL